MGKYKSESFLTKEDDIKIVNNSFKEIMRFFDRTGSRLKGERKR